MNEQITLAEVLQNQFFDRFGNRKPLPAWVNDERCGNCQNWQLLPEDEQPPNGWGIRGLCSGYTTAQTSYCQEWKGKTL